jgi:hypothetical protein
MKSHFTFAKHVTNEVEVEEIVKGRGIQRRWVVKSESNHYFDALYMSAVAGAIRGVALHGKKEIKFIKAPQKTA